jgi:hypothetical protein
MKHHKITAYHPQVNGLVKRFNKTLKQILAKISAGVENWDEFLAFTLFVYRSLSMHTIGVVPFFLEYGRALYLLLEIAPSITI